MLGRILQTLGSRIAVAIMGLTVMLIQTREMGPVIKGEISYFVLNLAIIVAVNNLIGGIVYMVPRADFKKIIFPAYLWSVMASGICCLIFWVFDLQEASLLGDLFILGAVFGLTTVNYQALLGKDLIRPYNIAHILQTSLLLASLAIFVFAENEANFWAYIKSLYIAWCGVFFYTFLRIVRYLDFSTSLKGLGKVVQSLFCYGVTIQLGNFAQLMNYRFSYFLLYEYFSGATLGVFSTGMKISENVLIGSKSISAVQYARISNTSDEDYAQKLTRAFLKISWLFTAIILIGLILIPESWYITVIGKGFNDVKLTITLMALGILAMSVSGIMSHYFSGRGRFRVNTISAFIGLLATLVAGLILIPEYGLEGAAITTSISHTVNTIYQLYIYRKMDPIGLIDFIPGQSDFNLLKKALKDRFKSA